jgi:signal transduction histidine kinase/CHASE3 domain sensor protein
MRNLLGVRTTWLVTGAVVVILLVGGAVIGDRFGDARSSRQWTVHTYQVLGELSELDLAVRDAETGQRGYLLTGDEAYLAPYRAALGRVTSIEGELQLLTGDNAAQQERLRAVAPLVQQKLEELAQTVALRRTVGLEAALRVVRTGAGEAYTARIESTIAAIRAQEEMLLADRQAASARRGGLVRGLVFGCLALSVLGLLGAGWTLSQAQMRAKKVEEDQRTIALRLRASLESLSQGVGVFDAAGRLAHWNQCFQVLLGLPPSLMRTAAPYAAFARPAPDGAGELLETEEQLRHGPARTGGVVTYERVRGDGHSLELRRTRMPDGGFVVTVSDMTQRAQAEAVLREAQKMQAIGQLTGGIAHDFNNLLTVILGNLEIMRGKVGRGEVGRAASDEAAADTAADEAQTRRLDRAIWAAQRGALLTAQLLAFARKQPLAPKPIDLGATMPDLVPLLRRTLGETIDVRYVESAGLWHAMADPAQLESAILNLALNARDAMPGGGRLTIELANRVLDESYAAGQPELQPGDYAMLAVSDSGHGMTPEVLARAMEPFFTTKEDGRGTGLGLPMVFGFVKQSGGHMKIYSEPGEGTTVRIYLPRGSGAVVAGPVTRAPLDLPRGSATIRGCGRSRWRYCAILATPCMRRRTGPGVCGCSRHTRPTSIFY